MDISLFSGDYTVRRMEQADVADIYLLLHFFCIFREIPCKRSGYTGFIK